MANDLTSNVRVYHVTPGFNQAAILAVGVDPAWSRGKREVSWWVTLPRLEWALAHVSARYAVSTGALWVVESHVPEYLLRRTKMTSVFTLGVVLRAEHMYNASHYLTDSF